MSPPPSFKHPATDRLLTIVVSERVFANLDRMAREAGRSAAVQAQLLFDAAYAARCKPTEDRALDAAVAAMDAPRVTGPEQPPIQIIFPDDHAVGRALAAARQPGETVMPHHAPALAILAGAAAIQEEADHDRDDDEPATAGAAESPLAGAVAPAEDAGAQPAVETVVHAPEGPPAGAEKQPMDDQGGPVPAAACPPAADVPPEAAVSIAQVKTIRMLRSIGNSPAEIADVVGVSVDQVRDALTDKKGRR